MAAKQISRSELIGLWEQIGLKPEHLSNEQVDAYGRFTTVLDQRSMRDTDKWLKEHAHSIIGAGLVPLAVAEILHQGTMLALRGHPIAGRRSRKVVLRHFTPEEAELGRLPGLLVTGHVVGSLPELLHHRIADALDGKHGDPIVNRGVAAEWLAQIKTTPTRQWEWAAARKRDAVLRVPPRAN